MSTPHARNIVRRLLAGGQTLRMQDIYKLGLEKYPATPFPEPPEPKRFKGKKGVLKPAPPQAPNPRHPFHSTAFLKRIVLPSLVTSNEIEKVHEVRKLAPEQIVKGRQTRSKAAIARGEHDVWIWRLAGRQAKREEPKLEDEPPVNERYWIQRVEPKSPRPGDLRKQQDEQRQLQNNSQSFGNRQVARFLSDRLRQRRDESLDREKRDPYGPGQWTHLNRRRQNARPEKLQLEQEWVKSVEAARERGSRMGLDERDAV